METPRPRIARRLASDANPFMHASVFDGLAAERVETASHLRCTSLQLVRGAVRSFRGDWARTNQSEFITPDSCQHVGVARNSSKALCTFPQEVVTDYVPV